MIKKEEQRLWDTMKANKPPGILMERVENCIGAGMPDVYFRMPVRTGWVELKSPHAPKRVETRLMGDEGLRQAQINWHLQSAHYDLISFVLIRDDLRRLWVVEGRYADTMNEWSVADLDANGRRCQTWWDAYDEISGGAF